MRVALFGQDEVVQVFVVAAKHSPVEVLDTSHLEICDEWQVKRWFSDAMPDLVLIGLSGRPETTSFEMLRNIQGSINVLLGSVGFARKARVFGFFASNSFFVVKRLCDLFEREKHVDFAASLIADRRALVDAAVLLMRDVSAKETHTQSSQGTDAGGEVHHEMVSESSGNQQHRQAAPSLLEVPVQAPEGKASSDLRAERDTSAGQKAGHTVHDNS